MKFEPPPLHPYHPQGFMYNQDYLRHCYNQHFSYHPIGSFAQHKTWVLVKMGKLLTDTRRKLVHSPVENMAKNNRNRFPIVVLFRHVFY